jgi:hypothetical protein
MLNVLRLVMLIYFMAIRNILQTFGMFYEHLVHFECIWNIFSGLGMMGQEKSGSPDADKSLQSDVANRTSRKCKFLISPLGANCDPERVKQPPRPRGQTLSSKGEVGP